MKNKLKLLILSGFLVLGAACMASPKVQAAESNTIPNGVKIGGRDVSGLTVSEAERALGDMIKTYDNTAFTLTAQDTAIQARGEDLHIRPLNTDIIKSAAEYGKRGNIIQRYMDNCDIEKGKGKDFELSLTCDWEALKNFLEEKSQESASSPVDHKIIRENGGFSLIEGHAGVAINAEESANLVSEYITGQWDGNNATIEISAEVKEPRGSKEDLLAVKDLLGSFSTDYSSSSANRASNVKNGASKLNQSIIYPGEVFSVSDNLGSRNAENGYLPAPSYENGTTVDTYGGGVCQISSTLYNALIRAELEITERSPHSMVVSYVKPSADAAISEGIKDLKFRNNLNYPIYIEGYTAGGNLYFNIFGKDERESGRKVSFESEVLSTTEPPDKLVADPTLPAGTISRKQSAHMGYTARLWKVVTVNGTEVSRDVFNNSSYRASSAIYNVGTATDDPALGAAVQAAIGTQNRDAVAQAVSGISPEGTPVEETTVEGDTAGEGQTQEGTHTGETTGSSGSSEKPDTNTNTNTNTNTPSTPNTTTPSVPDTTTPAEPTPQPNPPEPEVNDNGLIISPEFLTPDAPPAGGGN